MRPSLLWYENAVVQIASAQHGALRGYGTGFAVGDGSLIITCDHVLRLAGNPAVTTVRWPMRGEGTNDVVMASVDADVIPLPQEARSDDVALLRLRASISASGGGAKLRPLPLLPASSRLEERTLKAFGFPTDRGQEANLAFVGMRLDPLFQSESFQVAPGFSGSPIWDAVDGAAVGMALVKIEPATTMLLDAARIYKYVGAYGLQAPNALQPYVGLASFSQQDSRFYRGRTSDLQLLLEKIREGQRWIIVSAPSGSGKTSFLRAGVQAAMARTADVFLQQFETIVIRPGTDPQYALSETPGIVVTIGEILARVRGRGKARLLLIVDQLEDLYLQCDAASSRDAFVKQLREAIDNEPAVSVILSVRTDFEKKLAETLGLTNLADCGFRLPFQTILDRPAFRDIIAGPAIEAGWPWPPVFVDLMAIVCRAFQRRVGSVSGSDSTILPLLQFTLKEIWKLRGDVDPGDAYEQLGGLAGSVASRAGQYINSLNPQDRSAAIRVLLDLVHLVRPDQGEPFPTRIRRRMAYITGYGDPALSAATERIVNRLVEEHLIVTDQQAGEPVVELIHDSLLQDWKTFADWIAERADDIVRRQLIEERRRRWSALKHHGALLRGVELRDALRTIERDGNWLRPAESSFVRESERHEVGRLRKKLAILPVFLLVIGFLWYAPAAVAYRHPWLAGPLPGTQGLADTIDDLPWRPGESTDDDLQVAVAQTASTLETSLLFGFRTKTSPATCDRLEYRLYDLSGSCHYSVWDASQALVALGSDPDIPLAVERTTVEPRALRVAEEPVLVKAAVDEGAPAISAARASRDVPKVSNLSWSTSRDFSEDTANASIPGGILINEADANPALWGASALAILLAHDAWTTSLNVSHPDITDLDQELAVELHRSQLLSEKFRSSEPGKFNAVLSEIDPRRNTIKWTNNYSQYATTLALFAMLQTDAACSTWLNMPALRAANVIVSRFEDDIRKASFWDPRGEWGGSEPEALSFQIATELLIYQGRSGKALEPRTLDAIARLIQKAANYPVPPGAPASVLESYDGKLHQAHVTSYGLIDEDTGFSWFPWALAATKLWAWENPSPNSLSKVRARRYLQHLITDLVATAGSDATQSYQKSELLFALHVVRDPDFFLTRTPCASDAARRVGS